MKKIKVFLVFIFAFCSVSCAFADNSKEIALDTESSSDNFAERILEKNSQDEEFAASGTFIGAPKDSSQNEETVDTRSEIVNYDPTMGASSPKFFLFDVLSKTAKDVYKLEIERTDIATPLLKDKLTFKTEKGPLDNIHIWSAYQMNFSNTLPERGDTDSKFDVGLINILIDGQFKGKKENFRIMLDPTHRHSHLPFMEPFFQDLYVETHRIPHTSTLV